MKSQEEKDRKFNKYEYLLLRKKKIYVKEYVKTISTGYITDWRGGYFSTVVRGHRGYRGILERSAKISTLSQVFKNEISE